MSTLGDRLRHARKSRGYTQDSLAKEIGVSRGVIFNLEKNKTGFQNIVIDAISHVLQIRREWLLNGEGKMDAVPATAEEVGVLIELYEVAKNLSEDEMHYILEVIRSMKAWLKRDT